MLDFGQTFYDTPSLFKLSAENFMLSKTKAIFYFIHYILNDFIILLINLVVDIRLVSLIKRNLEAKHLNQQRLEKNKEDNNLWKLKEEEDKKASVERKANTLIVVNVFIYVFCRFPELLGQFYLYFNVFLEQEVCFISLFCYLVFNFIEYMYMLSYLFNIFLYYKFNSFFRKGLRNYFGMKKS